MPSNGCTPTNRMLWSTGSSQCIETWAKNCAFLHFLSFSANNSFVWLVFAHPQIQLSWSSQSFTHLRHGHVVEDPHLSGSESCFSGTSATYGVGMEYTRNISASTSVAWKTHKEFSASDSLIFSLHVRRTCREKSWLASLLSSLSAETCSGSLVWAFFFVLRDRPLLWCP